MAHEGRDMHGSDAVITHHVHIDTLPDDGSHLGHWQVVIRHYSNTVCIFTVLRSPFATASSRGVTDAIGVVQLMASVLRLRFSR